jgi:hypothetical protein
VKLGQDMNIMGIKLEALMGLRHIGGELKHIMVLMFELMVRLEGRCCMDDLTLCFI